MATKEGTIHEFYKMQASTIVNNGRIWTDEEFVNEIRQDMGLPKVSSVNIREISMIFDNTKAKELLNSKQEDKKA